jgi:DNA-binding transcriptional ArsR family regulator
MAEEKFVVFSMKETKAKKIAKVIANKTSRAILDLLASKRSSPSEISKELNIPLPTVKYNLDSLKEAGLIKATGYKYSQKGKKIIYYEPARKAIVLAPEKSRKNIIEFLGDKVIVPIIFMISLASGWIAQTFSKSAPQIDRIASEAGAQAGAPIATDSAAKEAVVMASPVIETEPSLLATYGIFIIVTAAALGILLGIYLAYKKRKK